MLTGYGSVESAVEAIRQGAFDFLTKPLIDEELDMAIQRALNQREVIEENKTLKAQLDLRFGMENIIGHDHRMLKIYDMIDSVADTRATVLITGESGTGKSMIARAIHRRSGRRDKAVCGSGLRGAAGNALGKRALRPRRRRVHGGHRATSSASSSRPTRAPFSSTKSPRPVPACRSSCSASCRTWSSSRSAARKTFKVDTRVILATNEDLGRAVAEGRFRQDLYYRINVINIELPSLRDRISDIPLLAEHFLRQVCSESAKNVRSFSEEALAALQRFRWPGNVRELQNVIERAVLLGKNPVIGLEDLPSHLLAASPMAVETSSTRTLKEALEAPERQIILNVLEANQWNRHATAEALGINRTTLYKKMKRLGLEDMHMPVLR